MNASTNPVPDLALLTAHLAGRPIQHTLSAHAKLLIGLGLAVSACDELDDQEANSTNSQIKEAAPHLAWTLAQHRDLVESTCRDPYRIRRLQQRLDEVLDGWLATEMATGRAFGHDDAPAADAITHGVGSGNP